MLHYRNIYIYSQNWIYLWSVGPLQYRLPLLGECSRDASVSVYQLVVLWEAAFGFSEFFLKAFSMCLPISWWVIYERTCPHHTECSSVFDQTRQDPNAQPSLSTQSRTKKLIPQIKNSPQKKPFCLCERGETKNCSSTKRHQNWQVQKLFWAVERKS